MNKCFEQNFHHFLVIERHPVVSLDLKGALTAEYPQATVTICMTRAHAEDTLRAADGPLCVLINGDLITDTVSGLLRDCVANGGRVICFGAVRDLNFPVEVVQIPFNSKMISAAVSGVSAEG